jgi:hypothetical protein
MSVFRQRTEGGFTVVRTSGSDSSRAKKLAKQRKSIGRLCPAAEMQARRKALNLGHGLRRTKTLGVQTDQITKDIYLAESRRRGMAHCALVGQLLEIIAEDNLFEAILGKVQHDDPPPRTY